MTVDALPLVDAVCNAALLLRPVREAGPNAGRFVEAIQGATGNRPPDPWCASFVAYVGSGMLGLRWPLPASASCDVLLAFARKRGILRETPARGDVFLVLASDTDATHTGLVTSVANLRPGQFRTVEGNSSGAGSRDGDGVHTNLRGPGAIAGRYAFVRWADLLR